MVAPLLQNNIKQAREMAWESPEKQAKKMKLLLKKIMRQTM